MLYDSRILKEFHDAIKRFFVFLPLVLLGFPLRHLHAVKADNPPAAGKEVVLKAADISPKIFPERVFFRGQSAPVQFRNSGGVHFADDFYVLAGLVDNSGYSTGIKEKYQSLSAQRSYARNRRSNLEARRLRLGFLNGGKFVVMDLGANDLLQAASQHDAEMKRPVPLQVLSSATAGSYRLYAGRDYVEFRRAH